jgi:hypothetical protein
MAKTFKIPEWTNRKQFEEVYDTFKKKGYNKKQRMELINSIRSYFEESGDMDSETLGMSLSKLNKEYGQSEFYDDMLYNDMIKYGGGYGERYRSEEFKKFWNKKSVRLLDFYLSWHTEFFKQQDDAAGIPRYGTITFYIKKK